MFYILLRVFLLRVTNYKDQGRDEYQSEHLFIVLECTLSYNNLLQVLLYLSLFRCVLPSAVLRSTAERRIVRNGCSLLSSSVCKALGKALTVMFMTKRLLRGMLCCVKYDVHEVA